MSGVVVASSSRTVESMRIGRNAIHIQVQLADDVKSEMQDKKSRDVLWTRTTLCQDGVRQTFTVPSALAVINSPASTGCCSIQVITRSCTFGGGLGCSGAACNNRISVIHSRTGLKGDMIRTSTRSHAHTVRCSSPQSTVASPCPQHERIRYDVLA